MRALISGISGQDGAYLARLLLEKGYEVFGTSRDAQAATFTNLKRLGVLDQMKTVSMAPNDFRSVFSVLTDVRPDEIYNLSGQSSVGLSFEQPAETMESIVMGTLNLLEAVRLISKSIRYYNAGSGECFGDTGDRAADESTPFHPRSPYAVAKASAHHLVANYREAYGLHACTGILFNHESPLRPERYVTRKIVSAAARISQGRGEILRLGNLDIQRDWGWSPEYVTAMHALLQTPTPQDLIIATGETRPLSVFVEKAFAHFGLDWRAHVKKDPSLIRPSDIERNHANPARAAALLGWKAQTRMEGVVENMCRAEGGAVSPPAEVF